MVRRIPAIWLVNYRVVIFTGCTRYQHDICDIGIDNTDIPIVWTFSLLHLGKQPNPKQDGEIAAAIWFSSFYKKKNYLNCWIIQMRLVWKFQLKYGFSKLEKFAKIKNVNLGDIFTPSQTKFYDSVHRLTVSCKPIFGSLYFRYL